MIWLTCLGVTWLESRGIAPEQHEFTFQILLIIPLLLNMNTHTHTCIYSLSLCLSVFHFLYSPFPLSSHVLLLSFLSLFHKSLSRFLTAFSAFLLCRPHWVHSFIATMAMCPIAAVSLIFSLDLITQFQESKKDTKTLLVTSVPLFTISILWLELIGRLKVVNPCHLGCIWRHKVGCLHKIALKVI